MNRAEVEDLLNVCEAADGDDYGSLDAFRTAATVGLVADLARFWLHLQHEDDVS